ncbi:MAG: ubiquinol-cytochrome C chaperone family protein [Litorimonas sp.]
MGFLSKILGGQSAAKRDARRIYISLMTQSRRPEFYGTGRVSDNYDGRIDVLTLHMACVLKALNQYEAQGERLGQALFDEMKDDFEVALREEGISDTGVAKRIKPMISYFYARVKVYTEALHVGHGLSEAFDSLASLEDNPFSPDFKSNILNYTKRLSRELDGKALGAMALCQFTYPDLESH